MAGGELRRRADVKARRDPEDVLSAGGGVMPGSLVQDPDGRTVEVFQRAR